MAEGEANASSGALGGTAAGTTGAVTGPVSAPAAIAPDRLTLLLIAAGAMLLLPYGERLVRVWLSDTNGKAASIVAFVAAILMGRSHILTGWPAASRSGQTLGLLALAVSMTVFLLGEWVDSQTATILGGAAVAGALLLVTQGWPRTWHLRYPLALLALATPLPPSLVLATQANLVQLATSLCHSILDALIGPVVRSGAHMDFSNGTSVWIINDCSGLEGITMLIPAAAILAAIYRPKNLLCWALIAATPFVLGLAGNLVRVLLATAFIYNGSDLVDPGTFGHEALGLTTVGGSFLLQWLLIKACRRR